MEKLLHELNFRYENQNVQPKKHDLTISENEFFKKEYEKLINTNLDQYSEFMKIQSKLEYQLNATEEYLKKLEFDYKNYKKNIESSMIWKFAKFLDKLFRKNVKS